MQKDVRSQHKEKRIKSNIFGSSLYKPEKKREKVCFKTSFASFTLQKYLNGFYGFSVITKKINFLLAIWLHNFIYMLTVSHKLCMKISHTYEKVTIRGNDALVTVVYEKYRSDSPVAAYSLAYALSRCVLEPCSSLQRHIMLLLTS